MSRVVAEDQNLVVVRSCGDNAEAALLRSLLESRGIPAIVRGENHRSMLGAIGAYIELDVLVPKALLESASQLLRELDSGKLSPSEDGAEVDGGAAVHLLGAFCPVHQRPATSTCARCGDFLCEGCGTGEGVVCTACESRLAVDDGGARARRRRWIAATMLFVFAGGPVLYLLLHRLIITFLMPEAFSSHP
jgi:hypothetical protein